MSYVSFTGARSLLTTALVAGLFTMAGATQSAIASPEFSGEAVSSFGAPGPDGSVSGPNDNVLTISKGWGWNKITLTSEDFNDVATGEAFKIAKLIHQDYSLAWGSYNAPVSTEFSFSDPDGLGNQTLEFDLDVSLYVLADWTELNLNSNSATTFTHDNVEYELALLGFSNDGGESFYDGFKTWKTQTQKHKLYAEINPTSVVVPLPAAAWGGMALFGLLGAAHRFRQRRLASL
ncbi:MAG: choice-of-anchor K domain-containing protein [Phycisphaeraceae bacterium]